MKKPKAPPPEEEEDNSFDDSILLIDEHALDKECIRLPNQYRQAAFAAAEAQRDIDEEKARRKLREAELETAIRQDPAKFGIEGRLTEAAIQNLVLTNDAIQARDARLRKLEHRHSLIKAVVASLSIKKSSLTNLVELHSAGYHAEVKNSAQGHEYRKQISRDRNSRPIKRERKEERED